jgi:chromosome segregation ATPase
MSRTSTSINCTNDDIGTVLSMSVQSAGLEHDNECLRAKLRQLRDENARLVAANHTLLDDVESVRYELHRVTGRLQNAEKQAGDYQAVVSELNQLHESVERDRKTTEQELKEWQRRVEESYVASQHSDQLASEMRVELDELKKSKRRVECK